MDHLKKAEIMLPWYKCKRDAIVVVSNFLIVTVFFSILGCERIGAWSQVMASWVGLLYLWPLAVYISWSMWPGAVALTIIATRLCLNHYWNWTVVSWINLSMIVAYAEQLYGFKVMNANLLTEGTIWAAVINLPIYFCIAKVVYIIRIKLKGKDGKE